MEHTEKRTELGDLGEFGLIDRIKKRTRQQNKSSVLGIGDDAAIIEAGDTFKVVSSDLLAEEFISTYRIFLSNIWGTSRFQ